MMFLEAIRKRNEGLLHFAQELHGQGRIPPNTYVIDRTAVVHNAKLVANAASKYHISLYAMLKQLAYDPVVSRSIAPFVPKTVAVDWMGARRTAEIGLKVGNLGHLVPVPKTEIGPLMSLVDPDVWTVFDTTSATRIADTARILGRKQDVLMRIAPDSTSSFPGQEGGVTSDGVVDLAGHCRDIGLGVVGVTSFPCIAWDSQQQRYVPTINLDAVVDGANRLAQSGFRVHQINAPGNTCVASLPLLAERGVSHAEPGHAFTGSNPGQAWDVGEEIPAVVYVTEVSTLLPDGTALAFGGGLYARGQADIALLDQGKVQIEVPGPEYIDYQFRVYPTSPVEVGDTVIMALRFQMFVVRSYRAVVEHDGAHWSLVTLGSPEGRVYHE